MQIADVMTHDVRLVTPNQSLVDAAQMMSESDCGVLPVGENDRLVGMITDRDIVVRGLAMGKGANALIKDVMSAEIKYCFDDEELGDVARNMSELQIRRLPVVNRDKRLVGILSLGDIALNEPDHASEALCGICEPSGQTADSHA